MKLIIIESPGKIHSYNKYLGKEYKIVASYGHIFDLPVKKISIDIKHDFEPTFEVMSDKKDTFNQIKKLADKAEIIYVMTDPDREGSGIGWNIAEHLSKSAIIKRAKTQEITKNSIIKAIDNACDMDVEKPLVDAFLARRILDRLVGYRASYPVKQATGGPSAGRVQSAALRFLAEREKEIQSFIPKKYWDITAELVTQKLEKIIAKIKIPDKLEITSEKQAQEICDTLKKDQIVVSLFEKRNESVKPYAPFTTSTLQQSASSFLGWSPKKTMQVAQSLYEASFITYMRTDSRHIVPEVVDQIRSVVTGYGSKYLPGKKLVYASGKLSQEAHEAIRPTDVNNSSGPVDTDESKLYRMIWKRTISSQMTDAEFIRSKAEFTCQKYILDARGSKRIFDGWQKVWDYGSQDDVYLPELVVEEQVKALDVLAEAKETKPPARYSEASMVKKMEQLGIGRPSTYAATIETLKNRKYITTKGKAIDVTELGVRVSDFMVAADFCFVDLGFTSSMENHLDAIAENKETKLQVLTEFWDRLKHDLANAKGKKQELSKSGFKCKCGGELLKKFSKWGPFYSCDKYPDCKKIYTIGEHGEPVEKQKKKIEYSDKDCPKCGAKMILRESKFGKFYGCSKYPACRQMRDEQGNEIKPKKKNKWHKKSQK